MALTEIEFVEKLKAGTATVEEAIDFAKSRPKVNDSAKKRINALVSGFKKMGLDITMPYKDLKSDDVLKLFTKEGSPDKSNRATNLQGLENSISDLFNRYQISGIMEKVPGSDLEVAMYPKLAGAGTTVGTQRTGMAGERPMRGLLPMEDFTKIYAEAVPLIESEYDKPTADLIKYHATTSNRPSQLQALKKSDVTISGNTITVAGKTVTKTDKKGRPPLSFDLDSPTGQLIKRNLDSSKSQFLFDTTDAKFNEAFAKHITPRLEPFSDVLPLAETKIEGPDGVQLSQKPVTSPSAVRSIVPKIMLDQFNVPEGLVQGVMGHVNASILRKNYAGLAPSTDIPKLLENPSSFAVGDFGTTQKNINLDLLSDDDKKKIAEDQRLSLIEEEKSKRAVLSADTAEATVRETKALASMSEEDIAKASQVKNQLSEETIREKVRETERKKQIAADERAKLKGGVDLTSGVSEEGKTLLQRLGIAGKYLPAIGIGTVTTLGVLSDPAQAAVDVGLEVGARALGAAAGPAAAVPMIMSPTELGDATRQEGDGGPATQEELMQQVSQVQQMKADEREDRKERAIRSQSVPSQYPDADNFLTMQPMSIGEINLCQTITTTTVHHT